jgi:hypothetical protein
MPESLLDHLDQLSVFGRSAVALFVILGLDWTFTAVHAFEEWKGEEVPLWRNFGAIVGIWLPNWIGFFLFTLALTVLLWGVGLAGIAGWLPLVGQLSMPVTIAALAALVGARISDTLVSHWGLYGLGYRPNPGLKSTPLYVIEAGFILLTFWKGLSLSPYAAWLGFVCGAGFFILVLPALRAWRAIAPSWQRTPWISGQPLPMWTKD